MRFIICGTILTPEVELLLPGASPAAGKYIRNLEKSLSKSGYEVDNESFVAIPGAKEVYTKLGIDDENIIFKNKTIIPSIIKYQSKVLKHAQEGDAVIFYNTEYFDLGLVSKLKRKGVKAVLILADHTGDIRETGGFIRSILSKRVAFEYKKFEYVIALSENVLHLLNEKAHVVIMEGGLDLTKFENIKMSKIDEITRYMYAGTLSYVTGVDILLEAIRHTCDPKVEFYISGKGPLENMVKEASKEDDRIKYIGYIPDEEYYQLIQKMDVFINPRNMSMEQNQNNFPSKVLEYLATGRAVISTKFPGWERFKDNFYFCESTPESVQKAINSIMKKEYDKKRVFEINREKAKQYNWDYQAKRITDLVNMKII